MSIDSVWEQKHAATSSIKSSPLLADDFAIRFCDIPMNSWTVKHTDKWVTTTVYADGHMETSEMPMANFILG